MPTLRDALESAIAADFDDRAAHSAYADFLVEQGDPRGELIQVQLALEDDSRPAAERQRLQKREKQLLKEHEREWLAELAPFLLDDDWRSGLWDEESSKGAANWQIERGWLAGIDAPVITPHFAQALQAAPIARCLRRLELGRATSPALESADLADREVLEVLGEAPFLPCLRVLRFGDPGRDEINPENLEYGEVYEPVSVRGDGLVALLAETTRLEVLRLFCLFEEEELFDDLPNLPRLRVFQVHHAPNYDIAALTKHKAYANLEELSLMPHAVCHHESFLPRADVIRFLRSRNARKLRLLRLRLSEMGDPGVKAIIDTGLIDQLETLDLRHGEVTDKGALALAKGIPGGPLQRLDLQRNRLTPTGIAALEALNLPSLRTDFQQQPDEHGNYTDQYLYDGDWE